VGKAHNNRLGRLANLTVGKLNSSVLAKTGNRRNPPTMDQHGWPRNTEGLALSAGLSVFRMENAMKIYEGMDGDEFRRGIYDQIAAMAYEGYLKFGRGGVVIDTPATELIGTNLNSDIIQQPSFYVHKDSPNLPDGIEKEFVRYDPEKEVLLLIQDDNGITVSTLRIPDAPPPKIMYQRSRN
jgi:hypothetical protein